ncbi:alkyldihydroxyacetonephosphate synthase [Fopius arisanus]|uniref:Alkylglycerone-phosphate synthase n=1 Tax=Fopius arisanus TaxID=64838 RepID=A0A9R1TQE1_9HYME|nr:PREDICTED: alkyldihydroxyacetonephosphate synthase [Fopius arisanus]XP_011313796.1 PREDICTED: alkyldihydroxyacetonephosphate synthase [Fopius arisanus]
MSRKTPAEDIIKGPTSVQSVIPRTRQNLLKWNGWGYKDSEFRVNEKMIIEFTGSRYPIGNLQLPYFTQWVKDIFGVDLGDRRPPQPLPDTFPEANVSREFLQAIEGLKITHSLDGMDRLFRAHGHTLREIYQLKRGHIERLPDIVLWPKCHDDVENIVRICVKYGAACIPIGGGTSVSRAASCPKNERRTIVSLDTSQMNRILWIDQENLVACCETGIIGQDLERELRLKGFTTGHEPDSYEFSSLGGWVATRASGMKKNTYGNIEDLLIRVKMVTGRTEDSSLILERSAQVPRLSSGPDFDQTILGSEGTLGVITEVTLKIRPLPKIVKYGSVIFPDFQAGVSAMREVARQRCQPASIRLMDNEQFQFGQALRPQHGFSDKIMQTLKQAYVTKIKGFNWGTVCVATLLFEGHDHQEVANQEKKIYSIAKEFGGLAAGDTNGERGYILTFVIAYIRDFGLEFGVFSESFETSVPWSRALSLCRNVKARVAKDCKEMAINHYLISCRVTQTYDAGCCIYFYLGFTYLGRDNPVETYEKIEENAREEIIASGGSISHHHGVGKMRARFYPDAVGDTGVQLYRATKAFLDPHNIFAAGNLDPRAKL